MSWLGERVLRTAALALHRRNASAPGPAGNSDGWEPYIRWQFDSSAALLGKYPGLDPRGKRVLEIGCGTGGRAAYLAHAGAARVVGIDINAQEIATARALLPRLYPELADRVEFHVSAESERLDLGAFDLVLLIDCLEHVISPPQMMRLAHSYTAPGGRCYAGCPGWYHAHGSHYGLMPFVNVFFSDETILDVMRWWVSRPDYVPSRFDSDPPVERWRGLYDLSQRPGEYMGKLTLAKMRRLVRHSIFPRAKMHVIGFQRPLARLVNPLRHVPVLREVAHSYVVLEFER
jgi:SAM-dependent methyltransferase